jgi:hypothetical protein
LKGFILVQGHEVGLDFGVVFDVSFSAFAFLFGFFALVNTFGPVRVTFLLFALCIVQLFVAFSKNFVFRCAPVSSTSSILFVDWFYSSFIACRVTIEFSWMIWIV